MKSESITSLSDISGKLSVLLKDIQSEESVEGQLRECKDYAERHNMTVVSSYVDRALSARTDDRPEFQKLIHDSAKKQFDVVLLVFHAHHS